MALSTLDHDKYVDLVILVVDGKRPVALGDSRINLIWAEDLDFPDYPKVAFKYNIIELNTALKPFAGLFLLSRYERVIYLDPDVCVFSELRSVHQGLDIYDAVFTPHSLSPYLENGRPSDRDLLRFGCFNLGFFGVKRSDSAIAMLTWWHERCLQECFYEPSLGLGVDQKWIDLVPAFFDGVGILRDIGLNVAFWNLHERYLSITDAGWHVNADAVLTFVHFSSFVESNSLAVADKQTRYSVGSRPDFAEAASFYRDYLRRARLIVDISDQTYVYSKFEDGTAISPALRRFYAVCKQPEVISAHNPFQAKGPVYQFAKKNRLFSCNVQSISHPIFKIEAQYLRQKMVIKYLFRAILFILGPNRYFGLMRYLSHYSSLLHQSDLL